MHDTNKMVYWTPITGQLDDKEKSIITVELEPNSEITQQAISQAVWSKIYNQVEEMALPDRRMMIEASEMMNLMDMIREPAAIADELMNEPAGIISQLNIAKENQLWKSKIFPIDRVIPTDNQPETLMMLLGV